MKKVHATLEDCHIFHNSFIFWILAPCSVPGFVSSWNIKEKEGISFEDILLTESAIFQWCKSSEKTDYCIDNL